jgi:E3 ubiquitin-protein ligase UBR7
MDSKANNPNESSASDNLDNSTCTMLDVLRENEELEENVAAVLGGSNDKFCTYDEVRKKLRILIESN